LKVIRESLERFPDKLSLFFRNASAVDIRITGSADRQIVPASGNGTENLEILSQA
jgi:hypothetical protein